MGVAVLVLGASGSGKSASMRNFNEQDVGVFNVASKPFPFRNVNKIKKVDEATYESIRAGIKSGNRLSYVIDDSQYLMAFESFDKSAETGYSKWTILAKNFEELVRAVPKETSPDTIIYFNHHIDIDENGVIKPKTLGKMLDQQLDLCGLFTVVLLAKNDGTGYKFLTQNDGTHPAKTPMGMFDSVEIDNDLKYVDTVIREYYGLKPQPAAKKEKGDTAK